MKLLFFLFPLSFPLGISFFLHMKFDRKYPLNRPDFQKKIRDLNGIDNRIPLDEKTLKRGIYRELEEYYNKTDNKEITQNTRFLPSLGIRIELEQIPQPPEDDIDEREQRYSRYRNGAGSISKKKSENFEIVERTNIDFEDIGGYDMVKKEMIQCVDLLKNYEKYAKFNVRAPKGLILEGPPGNGKTMLAKAFATEAQCNFIGVSGSDFNDKYVGVGSGRLRELFRLAKENVPCIIFIDEIDALARKRSGDGEFSTSEKDNTLNALLVELDGFKNNTGIFLVAATNRLDLLDPAFLRPGRIDKKIFLGLPDKSTRKKIVDIHIKGKPHDSSVDISQIVTYTEGLSGAQIENLLNEAMLYALNCGKEIFTKTDLDSVMNKILAGWQPSETEYSKESIHKIAIHEMGHAIIGHLSIFHPNVTKITINLFSPKSPGYTIFETSLSSLYTTENLFNHLQVLLAGRIAEEIFFNVSVTTGAINDLAEAIQLAEKMIVFYGMGSYLIYPSKSDKYKEMIDNETFALIERAYTTAKGILLQYKNEILFGAQLLENHRTLNAEDLDHILGLARIYQ